MCNGLPLPLLRLMQTPVAPAGLPLDERPDEHTGSRPPTRTAPRLKPLLKWYAPAFIQEKQGRQLAVLAAVAAGYDSKTWIDDLFAHHNAGVYLTTLAREGYLARTGVALRYRYEITDAGWEALAAGR